WRCGRDPVSWRRVFGVPLAPGTSAGQDRLPYQRGYRDRTDSEFHKFEEQSPSFVEDYYSTRRSRHHRRSRERHRTRKHQHRCRKRRTRSCSSTSSVSSIQNEFRKCSRDQ
ncbi:hypothetical protein E2320_013336, partial [Naja naja]